MCGKNCRVCRELNEGPTDPIGARRAVTVEEGLADLDAVPTDAACGTRGCDGRCFICADIEGADFGSPCGVAECDGECADCLAVYALVSEINASIGPPVDGPSVPFDW